MSVFESYNKCFISEFFFQILFNLFRMFAAYLEKSFVPAFRVAIEHLFDNLVSGERNYCFEKSSGKSQLHFESKNLCEPCNQLFA